MTDRPKKTDLMSEAERDAYHTRIPEKWTPVFGQECAQKNRRDRQGM